MGRMRCGEARAARLGGCRQEDHSSETVTNGRSLPAWPFWLAQALHVVADLR